MKYLLSFLLITLLFGCTVPVVSAVAGLGNKVKQCCASLTLEKKPVSLSHADEGSNSGGSVSIFEIRNQLIRTW
ncbi:MAG: hypothetical protein V4539_17510 [Bacteroidota bacterium]